MKIKFIKTNGVITYDDFKTALFNTNIYNSGDGKSTLSKRFIGESDVINNIKEIYDFLSNDTEELTVQAIDDEGNIVVELTNAKLNFLETNVVNGKFRVEVQETRVIGEV